MTHRNRVGARVRRWPGRPFLLAWLLTACQLAGPEPGAAPPEAINPPAHPVLEAGPISRSAEVRAAELLRSAEDALDSGDAEAAAEGFRTIVDDYPTAPVAGRALRRLVDAAVAAGQVGTADAAAERYIALLPDGDVRQAELRLAQARALTEEDPAGAVDRLLRISVAAPEELTAAESLLAQSATRLTPEERARALESVGSGAALEWVLQVQVAVDALEAGDDDRARTLAQAALDGGAAGPDAEIARGVLNDELPGGRSATVRLRIGTVLPLGGPPALADYARQVAEGVEVAATELLGDRFEIEVVSRDDQADPGVAANLVSELEGEGVSGIIGFLENEALLAAGPARSRDLPLISPTARTAQEAGEGVYSLEGPDPQAAQLIANYAGERQYARVAIVHSQAAQSIQEADAFERAVLEMGIPVVGRFPYEVGATFFESQIIGARDALRRAEIAALNLTEDDTLRVELLEPVAIFLPIPPEDVEFVGPQVSHFALDTLAIDVLGTSAWTDPQVLATVDPRHTSGVVATAPVGVGPGWAGEERFRRLYEAHYRRTLVSPVPAVGWDATVLLLEAVRTGATTPRAIRSALEGLSGIQGATGILSVVDGRVVREKEVVYVDDRTLVPIG